MSMWTQWPKAAKSTRKVLCLVILLVVAGCSEDETTVLEPDCDPGVEISIMPEAALLEAGAAYSLAVQGNATRDDLSFIGYSLEGILEGSDSTYIAPPASDYSLQRVIHLPVPSVPGDSLVVQATVRTTSNKVARRKRVLFVGDSQAPSVEVERLSNHSIAPGNQVEALVTVEDPGGIRSISLRLDIAPESVDSIAYSQPLPGVLAETLRVVVPIHVPLDTTGRLIASAYDGLGLMSADSSRSIYTADYDDPQISVEVHERKYVRRGQSAEIVIHARDNYRLKWVRVRFDETLVDSVSFVHPTADTAWAMTVNVPSDFKGPAFNIDADCEDGVGRDRETRVRLAPFSIMRMDQSTLLGPRDGGQMSCELDEVRERLYILNRRNHCVEEYDTEDKTFLPGKLSCPAPMDMTLSRYRENIGYISSNEGYAVQEVDLGGEALRLNRVIELTHAPSICERPGWLAEVADNSLVIGLSCGGSTAHWGLMNLISGETSYGGGPRGGRLLQTLDGSETYMVVGGSPVVIYRWNPDTIGFDRTFDTGWGSVSYIGTCPSCIVVSNEVFTLDGELLNSIVDLDEAFYVGSGIPVGDGGNRVVFYGSLSENTAFPVIGVFDRAEDRVVEVTTLVERNGICSRDDVVGIACTEDGSRAFFIVGHCSNYYSIVDVPIEQ